MNLQNAQRQRRARGDMLLEQSVDRVVDLLADEVNLSNADRVGPAAREKLKGPLRKYAKSAHPWQECVDDLTPHKGRIGAVKICVAPETPVDTDRGQVCMADLRADDLVWSYNEKDRIFELKPVLWAGRTRRHAPVMRIEVEGNDLIVTPDHLFLTLDGEWVEARSLRCGSLLLGPETLSVLPHAREAVARPVVLATPGVLGPEVTATTGGIRGSRTDALLNDLVCGHHLGDPCLTSIAHQRVYSAHHGDRHVPVDAPLVTPFLRSVEASDSAYPEDVLQAVERLSVILRGDDAGVAARAGLLRIADVPAERAFPFQETSCPTEVRGREVTGVSLVEKPRDVWDIEVADNYSFVCHSQIVLHNCSVLKDIIRGTTHWRGKNNPNDQGAPGVVGLSSDLNPCAAISDSFDQESLEALAAMGVIDIDELVADSFAMSAETRKALPDNAFAMPKQRRYPIHDRSHAANALARSKGKSEESAVREAVCKKYKDMPGCQDSEESSETKED